MIMLRTFSAEGTEIEQQAKGKLRSRLLSLLIFEWKK